MSLNNHQLLLKIKEYLDSRPSQRLSKDDPVNDLDGLYLVHHKELEAILIDFYNFNLDSQQSPIKLTTRDLKAPLQTTLDLGD